MRKLLRDATRSRHDQLDALMAGFSLDDPDGFTSTLIVHSAALEPVADWLLTDPSAPHLPGYSLVPSDRMHALQTDLATRKHPWRFDVTTCDSIDSDARLFNAFLHGAQYVTAGSHLGMAALSHQFRGSRWMQSSAFFNWPGGKQHWQQTITRLEMAHWSEHQIEQARRGAAWMFDRYIDAVNHHCLIHEHNNNTQP